MIKEIRVKNYKAFQEAKIEIKPITIFLGANSAGKSSIIQLLLLLQQTAEEASNIYQSALKISGKRINAGKYENLFSKNNIRRPIHLEFKLENRLLFNHIEDTLKEILSSPMFTPKNELRCESVYKKYLQGIIGIDEFEKEIEKILKSNDLRIVFLWNPYFNPNQNSLKKIIVAIFKLKKLCEQDKDISISFTISSYQNALSVSSFSIKIGDKLFLLNDDTNVKSDIINLNNEEKKLISPCFHMKGFPIFSICEEVNTSGRIINEDTIVKDFCINIVCRLLKDLRKEFTEPTINHISPLRAHPQRYYMLDKADVILYSLDTLDANAIAEVLKDNPKLNTRVNAWLNNYNLKIDAKAVIESIHKLSVSQSGLSLDITDVGFGISQVLPVIIQGFLSPKESLTLVEQPEIHLHPKMQADLADLFIDIVKESNKNKKLIIETHSEYLLRRLRRRMAEGINIKPEDVSINLFHSRTEKEPARIENLPIEPKGAFEWPEEYYGEELYKDTTEFLRLQ